jgi:hypothetical protein
MAGAGDKKWLSQLIECQQRIQNTCFAAPPAAGYKLVTSVAEPKGYSELEREEEIALPPHVHDATAMGLLLEIGRVWVKVGQNQLFIFDPDDHTQTYTHTSELPIVGVGLVRPKEDVFRSRWPQALQS